MTVARILVVLGILWGGTLHAQTTAELRGRVVDESGKEMPGAVALLRNQTSGAGHQAFTDGEGRFAFVALAAGTYTLTITFPGFAQVATTDLALSGGQNRVLDDIVLKIGGLEEVLTVTARRREENPQDVPMSISVLSGEALRERDVRDLRGVANATPNMEFSYAGNASGGGNFAQVFIRGVGQPDFIITKDPGVGIYVDGVYMARAPGSVLELLDVDRVEVLRGPQGTLFGKNTIGGAVQVVTKRPTGQFGGEAQVSLGSFDRLDLNASLDFPIVSGVLAGRVAALSRAQDGFYRRLAYSEGNPNQFGADVSRENGNSTGRQAGRVSLLYTPSNALEAVLSVDATKERQEATEYQAVALTQPANIELYQRLLGPPQGLAPYVSYVPTQPWASYATWPGYNNSDIWGTSLNLQWKGTPVAVRSITTYRDLFVQTKGDGDATPYNIVATGGVDIDQRQFSQELQVSGLAFGKRLNWIGGFWYFDERADDTQRSRQFAGLYDVLAAAPFQSIAPAGNPNAVCPAANCLGGGLNNANDRAIARLSRTGSRLMNNDSVALFVHGTYTFTPQWSLTVGMRQSWEQKEFTYNEVYPLLPVPFTDPGPNRANDNPSFPLTTLSDEWDVFTPKLGVEYKPKPDVLVYVQGSTGFKAGGFNGRPSPLTGLAPFGSEEIGTIETGFKSEWLERRVRLNGAYFYNSYRDIQISRLSPIVPGVRVEENAGDGRSSGFELEASGTPARGLTLATSLGFLDFKYSSLLPGVVPAVPAPTGSISLDAELPFSPKWTFNGAVDYAVSMGRAGYLTLRADYRYSAKYYIDPDNSSNTSQPAYSQIDMRAGFTPRTGRIEVFVHGTNLSNEAVVANGVTSGPNGSQLVTYKPPRQWLSGLRFRF